MQLSQLVSGIKKHENAVMSDVPFYASLFSNLDGLIKDADEKKYTKFEQLLIASISDALKNSAVEAADKKTILIISSTKGNINLLETEKDAASINDKISMHQSAKKVAEYFHFVNQPVVVSNACISGLLAMIMGMRFIQSGQYEHAVIAGADVISKFVLSGFQSFQAISNEPCKPFDEARNGINLGEGAGTVILSANKEYSSGIKITGGSVSNDANHISGPSRTGEELCQAINKAMKDAGFVATDIDFISAHGTATLYNDEMEAKAITLANMQTVPASGLHERTNVEERRRAGLAVLQHQDAAGLLDDVEVVGLARRSRGEDRGAELRNRNQVQRIRARRSGDRQDERCTRDDGELLHCAVRSGVLTQGPGGVSSDSACRYASPASGRSLQRSKQK